MLVRLQSLGWEMHNFTRSPTRNASAQFVGGHASNEDCPLVELSCGNSRLAGISRADDGGGGSGKLGMVMATWDDAGPSPEGPGFGWCCGVPREGAAVVLLLAVEDWSSSERSGHCCSTFVSLSLRARSAICLLRSAS